MPDAPTARDLLSTRYLTIEENQRLGDAFAIQLAPGATSEGEHTFVVTHADGGYAGLLSQRRFLTALFGNWNLDVQSTDGELEAALRDRLEVTVADVMERNRPHVAPDTPLPDLITLMVDPEFECLPVLEHGAIRGVIYVADVFRTAAALALTPETSGIRVEKHEGE